jgi:antitoxin component YwqK of YwqJK toxin-antitoxin module
MIQINNFKYVLLTLILVSCKQKENLNINKSINAKKFVKENSVSKTITSEEINKNLIKEYIDDEFILNTQSDNPIIYHKNGLISRISLISKQTNNITDLYNSNQHRKTICFYENGVIRLKSEYIGRFQHGEQFMYYENGQLSNKSNFVNGQKEGEQIMYYRDGRIQRVLKYSNDKREGESIGYYENAQLSFKSNYRNGVAIGKSIKNYENGKIQEICNDDSEFRVCKSYLENGSYFKEIKYNLNTGNIISVIFFNENGNGEKESEHYYDVQGNEIVKSPLIKENNSEVIKFE